MANQQLASDKWSFPASLALEPWERFVHLIHSLSDHLLHMWNVISVSHYFTAHSVGRFDSDTSTHTHCNCVLVSARFLQVAEPTITSTKWVCEHTSFPSFCVCVCVFVNSFLAMLIVSSHPASKLSPSPPFAGVEIA